MFEIEVLVCHALMVAALLRRYPSTTADATNMLCKIIVLGIINAANFVYSNWEFSTRIVPTGKYEPETHRISIDDFVTTTSMGTIKTSTFVYIELLSLIVLCYIPASFVDAIRTWLMCDQYYGAGYNAAITNRAKIK